MNAKKNCSNEQAHPFPMGDIGNIKTKYINNIEKSSSESTFTRSQFQPNLAQSILV